MGAFKDMTGMRVRMLTVIRRVEHTSPHAHWLCRCDCGKECVIAGNNLRGRQQSCGCANYGARGIRVCFRWLTFSNFLDDMGECAPGYSIERIDNNGEYCPENCKWIPLSEQSKNRRSVRRITVAGQSLSMTEAARLAGLNVTTVHYRIKAGWAPDRILEPLR